MGVKTPRSWPATALRTPTRSCPAWSDATGATLARRAQRRNVATRPRAGTRGTSCPAGTSPCQCPTQRRSTARGRRGRQEFVAACRRELGRASPKAGDEGSGDARSAEVTESRDVLDEGVSETTSDAVDESAFVSRWPASNRRYPRHWGCRVKVWRAGQYARGSWLRVLRCQQQRRRGLRRGSWGTLRLLQARREPCPGLPAHRLGRRERRLLCVHRPPLFLGVEPGRVLGEDAGVHSRVLKRQRR